MRAPSASFRAFRLFYTGPPIPSPLPPPAPAHTLARNAALLLLGATSTFVLALLVSIHAYRRAAAAQLPAADRAILYLTPLFPALSALTALGVLLWRPLLRPDRPQLVGVDLLWTTCVALFHVSECLAVRADSRDGHADRPCDPAAFLAACMQPDTRQTARLMHGLRVSSTLVALLGPFSPPPLPPPSI
jgi:hypothetical protein